MSVVIGKIDKQETKRIKMENKELRKYRFSGYTFGKDKLFNLIINVFNHTNTGTTHSVEIAVELSTEERLELIKMLINAGTDEQDKN